MIRTVHCRYRVQRESIPTTQGNRFQPQALSTASPPSSPCRPGNHQALLPGMAQSWNLAVAAAAEGLAAAEEALAVAAAVAAVTTTVTCPAGCLLCALVCVVRGDKGE